MSRYRSFYPARFIHSFLAVAFWFCCTASTAQAVTQWSINELPSANDSFQASQFRSWDTFALQVTFTHSSGRTFTVDGYWVGGNGWKVRYALPLAGTWTWTASSEVGEPNFTQGGSITVEAATVDDFNQNPNYHGHIQNGPAPSRYFMYADGTPFFYLGDTNWRMNTQAGAQTFTQWADDRQAKGFSVMQIAAFEIGQPNNSNRDAFEGGNWTALNFEHFPYLDTQFQELWNRGFVVAMHPMWITTSSMTYPEARNISRYLLARYGAYNIVWSLSGEFNIGNATTEWTNPDGQGNKTYANVKNLGNDVSAKNAYGHPLSVHPDGWDEGAPDPYLQSTRMLANQAWLSHHWLQTHIFTDMSAYRVYETYCLDPSTTLPADGTRPTQCNNGNVKPVIEAEGCYEDTDANRSPDSPITACNTNDASNKTSVRREVWASYLNGAAGHVYGAWGIFYPDVINISAKLGQPGSGDVGRAANLLRALNWPQLRPDINCVTVNGALPNLLNTSHPHCAGITGEIYVLYIPAGAGTGLDVTGLANHEYVGRWYDPRTGAFASTNIANPVNTDHDGSWSVPARPDGQDWVLLLSAHHVPGLIQAEDFDEGGEGVAYHDTDPTNNGGAFRNTGVDIVLKQGEAGSYVGWTRTAEWLNYTVFVDTAGTYTLSMWVASNGPGGTFHIEVDGTPVTDTITAPNTGSWNTWQTLTRDVTLPAGRHVVRIAMETANPATASIANFDYLQFSLAGTGGSSPCCGGPANVPGTIQAENFDLGGEGVAYHDTDAANNGGEYRPNEGVDISGTVDSGGGFDVGWTKSGEWRNHTINVTASGSYRVDVRVASNGQGGTFHIEFPGGVSSGPITIPNTGGWETWQTVPAPNTVNLAAGLQVMRVVMDTESAMTNSIGDLNWISLTAASGGPSGPVAHWKLDDGGGSIATDASGNGHNGTLQNGPTWQATGKFAGALSLDGVDDFVSFSPVIQDASAFTITAWVKTTSSQPGVIYSEENSGTPPYIYLSINETPTPGNAEFGISGSTGQWGGVGTGALNLNDGQWHFLAAVQRSKTDRELFVDGMSRGQTNVDIGTVTVNQASMGKFDVSSTSNRLQGTIDDVRIYSRALTSSEIQALFNGQ